MEVLVSLLVFGIGAVSVATLFPVAILQSINATRLTRGTIHRYNAEARVNLTPNWLVFDPDRDQRFEEHFDFNHAAMESVVDVPPAQAQPGGPSGPMAGIGYAGNNYVVDPLGWATMLRDNDGMTPMTANRFGNGGTNWLPRYSGLYNNGLDNRLGPYTDTDKQNLINAAQDLVISPDSWVQPFDQFLKVNQAQTKTTLPPSMDTENSVVISGLTQGDAGQIDIGRPPTRVTLFDSTGRFSHTRILTKIETPADDMSLASGETRLTWSASVSDALPSGFTAASVRIETQDYQFSWLLTVRNRSTSTGVPLKATVDVVIFFRRPISTNTERVYAVTRIAGSGGRGFTITVPAGAPQPFLKRGGYLCDVVNARWHRIQRISGEGTSTPNIWLEHEPPVGETVSEVIIPQGVVEVYPLGTKTSEAGPNP